MLENELKALMEGKRIGEGPNGLEAIEEFEKMMMAIPG